MSLPFIAACAGSPVRHRKAHYDYDAADFKGYRSPHVLVHSDASESAVRDVVQRLEEIWAAITTTMIRSKDDFPIEIILFDEPADFKEMTDGHLAGVFTHVRNRGVMMMPYEDGGYE